jgi:4-hydroxy-tetrahydrodipicolinate synthase
MTMRLSGIIPPLLTPFTESGEVDFKRIPVLVQFMKPYVKGFFVCGTYGSGPLMNVEERKRVFEAVAACVDDSFQLVAHVGAASQRDALELAVHAAQHGAKAVTAIAPFYYHYDEDTLFEYFCTLIQAVKVPVYLYDNPGASGNPVSAELIQRLAGVGLHGVKDSTFDINKTYAVMRKVRQKDFDVVIGSESLLLPAFAMGAQACIAGLANALPELVNELYEAACSDNPVLARELQAQVLKMWDVLHFGPSVPTALAMLQVRGMEAGYPRRPMMRLARETYGKVEAAMRENQSFWDLR